MEYIFDELKQYIIKEITENVIIEKQKYPNLIQGKKYLIVYYDNKNSSELIKMVKYAGKFEEIFPSYPGAYGDLCEGIYFSGIIDNDSETYNINRELFCNQTIYNFSRKFFELEYNFNNENILHIYNNIQTNNLLNDIQTDFMINSYNECICIFSKEIVDKINFN